MYVELVDFKRFDTKQYWIMYYTNVQTYNTYLGYRSFEMLII